MIEEVGQETVQLVMIIADIDMRNGQVIKVLKVLGCTTDR